MGLKVIAGSIFATAALLVFLFIKPYLVDNSHIVKVVKLTDDLNIVFVEDDITNLYVLNNYEIKHFHKNASFQKKLILKTKIYTSDINVSTDDNYIIIGIKRNIYLTKKIVHFQNYFINNDFKELKIFLKVLE